jgi:glycerol-3-phosphate dehydrogenase (NAD(P)+)
MLSGPNLYGEVLQGNPSATVIASRYKEVVEEGIRLFTSPSFKVYGSEDVLGVELGGVIKNVIAIAAGIVDGLNFGANSKAFLITRGMTEMGRIGLKFGANPVTFTGLAGIGDLVVTCSSKLSRNYRVGYYLAQEKTLAQILQEMKMVAEGVNTCKVLHEAAQELHMEIPIIEGVYQIVHQNRNIREVIAELMARRSYLEIDPTMFESLPKG